MSGAWMVVAGNLGDRPIYSQIVLTGGAEHAAIRIQAKPLMRNIDRAIWKLDTSGPLPSFTAHSCRLRHTQNKHGCLLLAKAPRWYAGSVAVGLSMKASEHYPFRRPLAISLTVSSNSLLMVYRVSVSLYKCFTFELRICYWPLVAKLRQSRKLL